MKIKKSEEMSYNIADDARAMAEKKYKLRVPELEEIFNVYSAVKFANPGNDTGAIIDLSAAFLSCFPKQPTDEDLKDILTHVCQKIRPQMRNELKEKDREND